MKLLSKVETRAILDKHSTSLAAIFLLVLGILVGIFGIYYINRVENTINIVEQFYSNASVELISISITVLIIDRFNKRRLKIERKLEIVNQIGSLSNSAALEAVRFASNEGWLVDGSLEKQLFHRADLSDAHLYGAKFREAQLTKVIFKKAMLNEADFSYARLWKSNFQAASLRGANFEGSWLPEADFSDADLSEANFKGAHVSFEQISRAKSFENAIMPDGNVYSQRDSESVVQFTLSRRKILMTDATLRETTLRRGDTIIIDVTIESNEDEPCQLWLGTTIVHEDGTEYISKKEDVGIIVPKGKKDFKREYTVENNYKIGYYTLIVGVWEGEISNSRASTRLSFKSLERGVVVKKTFNNMPSKEKFNH